MDMINTIGFIAGACTSIGFLPQVLKILKTKSAKDISYVMYVVMSLGFALWIFYGIAHAAFPVIVTNVVSLTFSTLILFFKIKSERAS